MKPKKYHKHLKIEYCYSGEDRLRKLTARNRDPCYSVLVEVPSDTADSIFLSFELACLLVERSSCSLSLSLIERSEKQVWRTLCSKAFLLFFRSPKPHWLIQLLLLCQMPSRKSRLFSIRVCPSIRFLGNPFSVKRWNRKKKGFIIRVLSITG